MRKDKRRKLILDMPIIGLGTWDLRGKECTEVVSLALELGYRHIDTAQVYGNHKAIAKAIADFDRSALFITSKLPVEEVDKGRIASSVEKMCDRALNELGTDYLDLYLIHWPHPAYPMAKILEAMEACVKKEKVRHAGVSNFTVHHLEDLRKEKLHPIANQVEFHPYLYQKQLLDYCKTQGVQLIAYRPFGKKELLKEPLFAKMGKKHGKNGAQVILRWLVQKDIPVIPKASSKKHLLDNLNIFDFSLSQEEMQELDRLNQNKRFCGEGDPRFDY